MKVVFLGSGNLATRLSLEMKRKGFDIRQVYSHTPAHAERLANQLQCKWTYLPGKVEIDADLYIFALKDTALEPLITRIAPNNGLWVHTAGSLPMDLWAGHAQRYGVFYPMQTFSKQREVDFSHIPVFVEGCDAETTGFLRAVAAALTSKVYEATSEQRRYLHLGAVLACNFTNHLYALASDLLTRHQLPFDALWPLIDETAQKVHELPPDRAQTGPAARGDRHVMDEHLRLLADDPYLSEVYRLLSRGIEMHR